MPIQQAAMRKTESSVLIAESGERLALVAQLGQLNSERPNPNTTNIDLMPTEEFLRTMNREDRSVPDAVDKVIPEITRAVDRIVEAFRKDARLIYLGAGTSGRLGMLDAAECPPTFGVSPDMVQGVIAGGRDAMFQTMEGAEDDAAAGEKALQDLDLTCDDVVVGITASGRTPYVIGGLTYAKNLGATTVALACNPNAAVANIADIAILPDVGEEVLAGSTRLKSGTAQKQVLNMLSTGSMIGLGKCYKNLMVDVKVSNEKLFARAARLVTQVTDCSPERALAALERTKDLKLAILTVDTGISLESANAALVKADGNLRKAIAAVAKVASPATPAP